MSDNSTADYSRDDEDFEELFKKLALDYKHVLNDDDEKLENNNKMQVDKI